MGPALEGGTWGSGIIAGISPATAILPVICTHNRNARALLIHTMHKEISESVCMSPDRVLYYSQWQWCHIQGTHDESIHCDNKRLLW